MSWHRPWYRPWLRVLPVLPVSPVLQELLALLRSSQALQALPAWQESLALPGLRVRQAPGQTWTQQRNRRAGQRKACS